MTNQRKIYKIFMEKQLGWDEAINKITDSAIAKKILQSEKLQIYKKWGVYFQKRAILIDQLDDIVIAQKLYIEAIQEEIERLITYMKNNKDADILQKIKFLVRYIEKIMDFDMRKKFLFAAADVCAKQRTPVVNTYSISSSGKMIGPGFDKPFPIRQLEEEIREKANANRVFG